MFSWFEKLVDPYPQELPTQPPAGLLPFFWYFTKGCWHYLALMTILITVFALVEVWLFSFMGNIVDWLSNVERDKFFEQEGATLALMLAVVLFILPALGLAHSLLSKQAIMGNFSMRIRWLMHRYLLRQSMSFFANEFAGRIATKVMQTSLAVRDATMSILDVMVFTGVYFLGSLLVISQFHWTLILPFLGWLILYSLMLRYLMPKFSKIARNQADARSIMTGRIVDSYTNINTVKLFAHAEREEAYARESMNLFMDWVYPQMRLGTIFEVTMTLLNGMLFALATSLSVYLWYTQQAGVGSIAVVLGVAIRLQGMAHWVMWELARLFESIGIVRDGINMMSVKHDVVDKPNAKLMNADGKPIEFEKVNFSYGSKGTIIKDLSLKIAPGEKVGLVGRSGAGKTTVTNLLLRFYDVEGGKILIGNDDIADVTQESLRANIGMVTQDTSLLHRSVRGNIAYSRPQASEEEIVEAAKRANAWEFISELEDREGNVGLDAKVGERGVKLSGGQRQRIAIARIFLKNAPILVLDEATSALDSEVEAAIQVRLFELMEGKTVIAIAHRLSTIAEMDRLIVMDQGEIVQIGTHEELIAVNGIYSELWSRQSGGFLPTVDKPEEDEN